MHAEVQWIDTAFRYRPKHLDRVAQSRQVLELVGFLEFFGSLVLKP